jgi:hypothetical protein
MVWYALVPDTRDVDPTVAPSMLKVTVPVGMVAPERVAVRLAVTCMALPAMGVVVAGTTANVVTLLVEVTLTGEEETLV